MALGTITSRDSVAVVGPVFIDRVSFPGDSAYPTGGTTGFLAKLQAVIGADKAIVAVLPQDCGGYTPVYDYTNDKLKVYYSDNNNTSDGPAIEVPNTTDLSGTTFNVVFATK
jgi:hypothetical protein